MTIHQLSVFIENKSGTLLTALEALKDADIQIIASTIADTLEYGIYRIICSEPDRAFQLLREAGISVQLTDVFALALNDSPGQAAKAVRVFTQSGISINYMYSFLLGGKGILVFRTSDHDKAQSVISLHRLPYVTEEQLLKLI